MHPLVKAPQRGEIWLTNLPYTNTCVQGLTRPVVVVSNNIGNQHSNICLVVPMTTKNKPELPTHVKFMYNDKPNIILCEQVLTISMDNLLYKVGAINTALTNDLNNALEIALALKEPNYDRKTV